MFVRSPFDTLRCTNGRHVSLNSSELSKVQSSSSDAVTPPWLPSLVGPHCYRLGATTPAVMAARCGQDTCYPMKQVAEFICISRQGVILDSLPQLSATETLRYIDRNVSPHFAGLLLPCCLRAPKQLPEICTHDWRWAPSQAACRSIIPAVS